MCARENQCSVGPHRRARGCLAHRLSVPSALLDDGDLKQVVVFVRVHFHAARRGLAVDTLCADKSGRSLVRRG